MTAKVVKEGVRWSALWPLLLLIVVVGWFVRYSLLTFENALGGGPRLGATIEPSPTREASIVIRPTGEAVVARPTLTCQEVTAFQPGGGVSCVTPVPTLAVSSIPPVVTLTASPAPSPTPTPEPFKPSHRLQEPFRVYLFMSPDMQTTILEHPQLVATPGPLPPGVVVLPPDYSKYYVTVTPLPSVGCPWGQDSPNCALVTFVTSTPAPRQAHLVTLRGRVFQRDVWRGWRSVRGE